MYRLPYGQCPYRRTGWRRLSTSRTSLRLKSMKLPLWLIWYAATVRNACHHRATCMPILQVDWQIVKSDFYHISYQLFQVIASRLVTSLPQSTLMSPASIMSFACGICFVSYFLFFWGGSFNVLAKFKYFAQMKLRIN